MCWHNDCPPRTITKDFPDAAGDVTVDFGQAVFIWEIIINQGATALAASVTLDIKAPFLKDALILDLDAGEADDDESYPVMRQGAASDGGSAISGTAVPWYIPDGKIVATLAGTGVTTNTASITVIASEAPPPWR